MHCFRLLHVASIFGFQSQSSVAVTKYDFSASPILIYTKPVSQHGFIQATSSSPLVTFDAIVPGIRGQRRLCVAMKPFPDLKNILSHVGMQLSHEMDWNKNENHESQLLSRIKKEQLDPKTNAVARVSDLVATSPRNHKNLLHLLESGLISLEGKYSCGQVIENAEVYKVEANIPLRLSFRNEDILGKLMLGDRTYYFLQYDQKVLILWNKNSKSSDKFDLVAPISMKYPEETGRAVSILNTASHSTIPSLGKWLYPKLVLFLGGLHSDPHESTRPKISNSKGRKRKLRHEAPSL